MFLAIERQMKFNQNQSFHFKLSDFQRFESRPHCFGICVVQCNMTISDQLYHYFRTCFTLFTIRAAFYNNSTNYFPRFASISTLKTAYFDLFANFLLAIIKHYANIWGIDCTINIRLLCCVSDKCRRDRTIGILN